MNVIDLYTKRLGIYHLIFCTFFRYHKGINYFFEKSGYIRPNFKILDAGCGSGVVTKELFGVTRKKGLSDIVFHAFDITPAMLNLFNNWIYNNEISNIFTYQSDALNLNLPEHCNNYDLIVSSGMLEYLPKEKLSEALKTLKHLLNPNGRLIIFITKKNWMTKFLIKKWWCANIYNSDELIYYLKKSGFLKFVFKSFPMRYCYLNRWGFVIEL